MFHALLASFASCIHGIFLALFCSLENKIDLLPSSASSVPTLRKILRVNDNEENVLDNAHCAASTVCGEFGAPNRELEEDCDAEEVESLEALRSSVQSLSEAAMIKLVSCSR